MKIIFDECVPRRLRRDLPYHVTTVQQLRLTGLDNGELLNAIENDFDVFITVDQNLQFQQNLNNAKIAIVVLAAATNRYEDLLLLIPSCLSALKSIRPGQVTRIQG